ncbi:hypothetical protein Pan241w_28340 [Gimesia alba]|uniref:Lipoprotein n=1 Tax=Gimesia alba TaxID=2527973 RepID=A0A517RFX8_9PLAN|nr:hypothetical protein Pan241w_28340 [Gimesia alba]
MRHHVRYLVFFLTLSLTYAVITGCGPNAEELKRLNPEISANWGSKKVTETSGATSYIFEGDVKPPLKVNNDENATLASIDDVNAVLKSLNLPTVSETRPDKGSLEKRRYLRGQYHWPDYPLGLLVVERMTATDKRTYENYDAIWKVRIDKPE